MVDARPFAAKSDEELAAMEQDKSLPMDQWMAVEAERGRRLKGSTGATPAAAAPRAGEDAQVNAALTELRGLMVPGERLQAYAVQRRLFALSHRRVVVGATTGRFIALSRGLIGGYQPYDVRWQDLRDVSIRTWPRTSTPVARGASSWACARSRRSRSTRCVKRRSSRGAKSGACAISMSCARSQAACNWAGFRCRRVWLLPPEV